MRYNLSEVVELIKDRRTIFPEQFSSRKVHKEIVRNLLASAVWAPNHGKTEPWRFTVFMGEQTNQLADAQQAFYKADTAPGVFSQAKFDRYLKRAEASSAIIGLGMKRQEAAKIPEEEEVIAVGCAAQNILLHATAYGIGSFWSSGRFIQSREAFELMGLEAPDRILGFIYLGYPEVEWPKSHRKPVEYVSDWRE